MSRVGVFICWCGSNISATVDVAKVTEYAATLPGVVFAAEYKYMCSDPGQRLIKDTIEKEKLTSVVVASCSPRMHETTFRSTVAGAGLNPYLFEMTNIREHCSWVHDNIDEATEKAKELVKISVEKVKLNEPLSEIEVPLTKRALVIGGGIAGIQAALDISQGNHEVVLVEREPSIGGHMAQLDETFPTLDCSQCIMTPRMVEIVQRKNIKLYTYSEIEEVSGFIGNFNVKIRKKARSIDESKCTGCGLCQEKCPTKVLSEFEVGLGKRKAIYSPFPQAVPKTPVIDRERCIWFKKKKCGICKKVCPPGAILYEQEDEIIEEKVGAIVVATGYDLLPTDTYEEYGGGKYKDIISGLQFERLISASGPTGGKLIRPSDGKTPKSVVFIQCVGSRDPSVGRPYCSKICCMYTAKHAMLLRHKVHGAQAYVFYIDVRAGGKNYEQFVRRAIEQDGAVYLRGRVSKIYNKGDKLVVKGADTLSGAQVEIETDMVVLATAIKARSGSEDLAQKLKVTYDEFNFFSEAHPKLRPVETNTAGVYLAGACQSPKDIPDSVSQASATAGKVLGLFASENLKREPLVAQVNENKCVACWYCVNSCPFGAAEKKEIRDRRGQLVKTVANINKAVCQGCGLCVSNCRPKAIELSGFTDQQLAAQVDALSWR